MWLNCVKFCLSENYVIICGLLTGISASICVTKKEKQKEKFGYQSNSPFIAIGLIKPYRVSFGTAAHLKSRDRRVRRSIAVEFKKSKIQMSENLKFTAQVLVSRRDCLIEDICLPLSPFCLRCSTL